jgi:hypothetical protein
VGALRHARPLDDAVGRLERAIGSLETGRHPQTVARVVAQIREERGGH